LRCKVFYGARNEAKEAFNKWAKGKALAKDVIIHTHVTVEPYKKAEIPWLVIVVFYPEGSHWEKEKESPIETMAKI